jgi:hypothetical protein
MHIRVIIARKMKRRLKYAPVLHLLVYVSKTLASKGSQPNLP